MLKRIITAVIGLAVFAAVLAAPVWVFTAAVAAVILCMLHEYYGASKADMSMRIIGFISALALMVSMYALPKHRDMNIFMYISAAAIMLLYMALIVVKHGKRGYRDILSSCFMTTYITVSMWCINFTAEFFGKRFMLLIFVSAWCCDTFAYFTGRAIGRHKLIPNVSPNKTVEGSIGGVIGAMLCCILYMFILSLIPSMEVTFGIKTILTAAVIGLAGGIFSQVGDLAASAIKRDEDIKDFGSIMPGHGGFMDRFDSVMYISPIVLMLLIPFVIFI